MTEDAMGNNTIAIVDVLAMKKIGEINLGRFHRPHGIASRARSCWLLPSVPFDLSVWTPAARRVVRDYDVQGKSPHMVMPFDGGRRAFVSNSDSDSLAVVDIGSGKVQLIPTGSHPQGGVLSRDGKLLYLTCTNANQIAIVDTAQLKVTGHITTGKGPARIALTPDGRTLVYNLQMEPGVGFADVASGKQTGMVPVSARPLSLTLTGDGRRAFAGIQEQDKVAFISVPERKIERILNTPKGSGPDPAIPLERNAVR